MLREPPILILYAAHDEGRERLRDTSLHDALPAVRLNEKKVTVFKYHSIIPSLQIRSKSLHKISS